MKRICLMTLCAAMVLGFFSKTNAERVFSLGIGMKWPQALLSTAIPSGDAELNYGALIDKKVGFGICGDFLWNIQTKDTLNPTTNTYFRKKDQKNFMIPVMGFFFIDPVPHLMFHPVVNFKIGYNSLIHVEKSDSLIIKQDQAIPGKMDTTQYTSTVSPYFFGLIIKGGIDVLYNIGESSAFFLGLEYQWANTRTTDTSKGFNRLDMSGIGLKGGFRVAF